MKLNALVESLGLTVCAGAGDLDREVSGGYAGDLLSDVIANSNAGDLWVTLQGHENAVAVATLRDLAGIVLIGGREPDAKTLERAELEGVVILVSNERAFEVVARMAEAGVPRRAAA